MMTEKNRTKNQETPVELTEKMRKSLSRFTAEEIESGVVVTDRSPARGGHTATAIKEAYSEAITAHTIGEMFRHAREAEGQSLSGAASQLNVSKGRVAQIEKPDANLRITTLQQTAKSYGYKVQVTLLPEDESKKPITAELPA